MSTVPATTVEIGFDLSALGGPFFILDDPVQGVLDNPTYTLGGTLFYDVSDKVLSVSVNRGKSRQLDKFTAGNSNITFINQDRAFDPLNASSPFFGQIIPRRTVRITTSGSAVFYGSIDDWNLNYDISGYSTAGAVVSDGFTYFAQQVLTAHTATSELTGARIGAVLDRPEINWPASLRSIDTGGMTLQADVVEDGTNTLDYLQLVNFSEPGSLFMGADGSIIFKDRTEAPTSSGLVSFTDDGTGIPFVDVQVVYGSELLYNFIQVERNNGGTATASDSDSQNSYGVVALVQSNLLMSTDAQAQDLADYLLGKYSEPEYRFERLTVVLEDLTPAQQASILSLEIGDISEIKFTPNQTGTQIDKYASIIAIEHDIRPMSHRITYGFETLDYASLVLDDLIFGLLDDGRLSF
jgi:hypothetical protein